jgi:hypothetical protein
LPMDPMVPDIGRVRGNSLGNLSVDRPHRARSPVNPCALLPCYLAGYSETRLLLLTRRLHRSALAIVATGFAQFQGVRQRL